MNILHNLTRLRLQAALLALACGAQSAQSVHAADDAINPDRPNVADSSQVVGRGRVQLEIGANWDRERDNDPHLRTVSTPTLLRFGLGESTELRIASDGRSVQHDIDPASGARTTSAGWAATSVGFKWHLADGEGVRPALGLSGNVTLPSGSPALRVKRFLPQATLSAEWDLPDDWSLALMPGAGTDVDESSAHYSYGILAASLGKKFSERAQGFFELAAPQIASASHGGKQMQVDVGVSWLLNNDCQVDAMLVRGLNRNTPDFSLAFGLSVRR